MPSVLVPIAIVLVSVAAIFAGGPDGSQPSAPLRGQVERIALHPVAIMDRIGSAGQAVGQDLPLIRIGSLPAGEALPVGAKDPQVDRILSGALPLWQARAHAPVAMLFISPEHNSGEDWYVNSISKTGARIDVDIDGFTDAGERLRNVRSREIRFFSLGELDEGGYELHVRRRQFFKDQTPGLRYFLKEVRTGKTSFAVVANDDIASGRIADITLRAPMIRERDLKPDDVPAEEKELLWQPLTPLTTELLVTQPAPASIKVFRLGTFDVQQWLNTPSKNIETGQPKLTPPGERDRVYAVIVSPVIFNSGEAPTVREVSWKANHATIRIDVWRDNGARKKNLLSYPVMVIPLELPIVRTDGANVWATGAYSAGVEFTLLHAVDPSGRYVLDAHSSDFKDATAEFAIK